MSESLFWQTLRFLQQRDGAAKIPTGSVLVADAASQRFVLASPPPGPGYFLGTDPGAVGGVSWLPLPGLAPTPEVSVPAIDPYDLPETRRVVWSLLSIVETGGLPSPTSRGTVAILKDRAGISYGQHQATDAGGTLDAICVDYVAAGGRFSEAIRTAIPRLAANETASATSLDSAASWIRDLAATLQRAGLEDPIMAEVQDAVFARIYWLPAIAEARALGLRSKLALAVIYDSHVQSGSGGVSRIRPLFAERPPTNGGEEKAWVAAYVGARAKWLETFKSTKTSADPTTQARIRSDHESAVHASAYRMRWFGELVALGRWDLPLPLKFGPATIPA